MKRFFTLALLALTFFSSSKAADWDTSLTPTYDGATYYCYFISTYSATPSVWAWNDSGNMYSTWPGSTEYVTAMGSYTKDGTTYYVYRFATSSFALTKIIFSQSGSPQTNDITFTNAAVYDGFTNYAKTTQIGTAGSDEVVYDTWTIVGAFNIMNGTESWVTTNTDNDMTTEDGNVYTLTIKDKTLEKGSYAYKSCKGHAWGTEVPSSGNNTLEISENGIYTIVYTLNVSEGTLTATATKTGEAGVITHTYTVAGDEAICGTDWSVSADAGNDMVENEETGLYEWTSQTVSLTASTTYGFKVALDHDWGVAYPSDNYNVTTDKAGNYTLTVTYNPSDNAVTGTLTYLGVDYYISGQPTSFFGAYWDASQAEKYKFTYDSDLGYYYWTGTGLIADTSLVNNTGIRLKAYDSAGNWYRTDNYIINKDNGLYAHGDYTVTVYFDPTAEKLTDYYTHTSEQVSIKVSIQQIDKMSSDQCYATMYYEKYNLEVPENVSAVAGSAQNGTFTASKTGKFSTGDIIPAGTAVVLMGDPGEYSFNVEPDNDVEAFTGTNDLIGTEEDGTIEAADGYKVYILSYDYNTDNNLVYGFYWQSGTAGAKATVAAHRAVLQVKQDTGSSTRAISLGGNTTGISSVDNSQLTVDSSIFDLQGRKVSKLQKGINIVNGNKVFVK